ncbi:hypothetical protein HY29_16550 [Hyphomonas beringensis]|uniref:DUF2924 domain-containing protein n=1 Tax=Hyphomonas beringensis TaxID=1280946 RepID=A0A062UAJ7_9PROT|nr:DUF2924 domain-containing protein [Hyphomonas beringensis]KCZ53629.1 hypothetical protein HY29_16550 [Hyphomonas beringensis]
MMLMTELQALSRTDLVGRYEQLLDAPPPKGLSRPLLCRIVAFETQAAERGGLGLRLRMQLRSIADEDGTISPTVHLKSDARLVREWNGVSHVVDRVGNGFSYRGKTYRSLSAIAKEITGAKWSGPRFFGLKRAA